MAEQKLKKRVVAAAAMLAMSAAGLAWLSQEEGRKHVAYLDTAKVWDDLRRAHRQRADIYPAAALEAVGVIK